MGWKRPDVKWSYPAILRFSLRVVDDGKEIDSLYLGTRGYNEPAACFMVVSYGLTESPEREVTREEAIEIYSRWLAIPGDVFPWMPVEYYRGWIDWAMKSVVISPTAEEVIGRFPFSCSFRIVCD